MNQRQYIKLDQMNRRLKLKIEMHNNASWTPDSKRIIIKTLKPNCDKSLKRPKQ